jgi:hypothetical protein
MRKLLLIFPVIFCFNLFAQDTLNSQQWFNRAECHMFNKQYREAARIYQSLLTNDLSNKIISYNLAIAYLNYPGHSLASIPFFQNVFIGPDRPKVETYEDYFIYLGKSQIIEPSLENNTLADTILKKGFKIDPFQPYTNIVLSGNGKTLILMSNNPSEKKILYSSKEGELWTEPEDITGQIGSIGNSFPSSLSADGNRLYITEYDNFESDIYVCTFNGKTWSLKKKLNANVNSNYWEAHAVESPNGAILYFSSNRPGGFGGMDIYYSNKVNTDWGKPINAGIRINTFLNDDYPYLTNDGNTLIYASQGIKKGRDGYDLYFCHSVGDNTWSEPVNMGYPLNTPEDDIGYTPLTEQSEAFFKLLRTSNLSNVLPGNADVKVGKLLLINGRVFATGDKKDFSDVQIEISGKNQGSSSTITTQSNPEGYFNFFVREGIYTISYSCPNYSNKVQNLIVPYLFSTDTVKINQTLLLK